MTRSSFLILPLTIIMLGWLFHCGPDKPDRMPESDPAYNEARSLEDVRTDLKSEVWSKRSTAILAAIEGCYQLASAAPDLVPVGFAFEAVWRMAGGLFTKI